MKDGETGSPIRSPARAPGRALDVLFPKPDINWRTSRSFRLGFRLVFPLHEFLHAILGTLIGFLRLGGHRFRGIRFAATARHAQASEREECKRTESDESPSLHPTDYLQIGVNIGRLDPRRIRTGGG